MCFGRLFGVALFFAGALAARAAGGPGAASVVVTADEARGVVRVLECEGGRGIAEHRAPAPLALAPATSADGAAVVIATAANGLERLELPELAARARAAIGFAPTALAIGGGPDAIVLAGGTGALLALDAVTLAPLRDYAPGPGARVSALLDVAARRRVTVAFGDRDELWEIAYDRDAPPVLQGYVHDYRSGEAVPLPGRLTPRVFRVAGPSAALFAGAAAPEIGRLDGDGGFGIVNLDVRREIERPALPRLDAARVAAWRDGDARGWIVAGQGAPAPWTLAAGRWRAEPAAALRGTVEALASVASSPDGNDVVALVRDAHGAALWRIDPGGGPARRLPGPTVSDGAARLVASTDGACVALVDREGRWLAGWRTPR